MDLVEPIDFTHAGLTDSLASTPQMGKRKTGHLGDVLKLGHGLDEVVHGKGAGLVTSVSLGGLRSRDGAARGENFYFRQRPGRRGKRQQGGEGKGLES